MRDTYLISLIGSTKLAIRNQLMDHSFIHLNFVCQVTIKQLTQQNNLLFFLFQIK
jgi:hypothetical protein